MYDNISAIYMQKAVKPYNVLNMYIFMQLKCINGDQIFSIIDAAMFC